MDTDAELIGRASRANADPFVEVIRRHERPIFAYLCRRVERGSAEDLLAEVWIAAFADRQRFDPAWPSARPWLFGIARNRLRTFWRQSRPIPLGPEGVIDPWPEVDARLDIAHASSAVAAALRRLPGVEQEVLLLVAWEGLTPTEAAVVLGLPAGTARSRLHRARASMREQLAEIVDTHLGCGP